MTPTIKFSHRYKKMPVGVEYLVTFIEDIKVTEYSALSQEEITKDTETLEGEFYNLPYGWLIYIKLYTLTMAGPVRWGTMRRYTESKYDYYKGLKGKEVQVKIVPIAS